MSEVNALGVADVSVRYGKQTAVEHISFEVQPGHWWGLIGPNGSGKSSLLRAIAGLQPHEGTITADGVDLGGLGPAARARTLAFVPQEPMMPDDMTVMEYVLLGRTPHLSYFATTNEHDREIARGALSRLDAAGFADRQLCTLSGGERQRVLLARSLATQAPLLILDEPTTALDIGHQQQALELVDELRRNEGLTVVAAVHDLTQAAMYCEQLIMLHHGTVVANGTPGEVLTVERIESIFDAAVAVTVEDGTVVVTPRRGRVRPPIDDDTRSVSPADRRRFEAG